MDTELKKYREEIDVIDRELVELIEKRMTVAAKIAVYKKKRSLPVFDGAREDEKLTSVINLTDDTMKPYVRDLYKNIFKFTRTYEKHGVICRLATEDDLPALRRITPNIVAHMNDVGVPIWDDVYPVSMFPVDIEKKRLYVLDNGRDIVAIFALLEPFIDTAKNTVIWEEDGENAMYLYRLCVNTDYLGHGYASLAVEYSKAITRAMGRRYVRLYVVDTNKPAVRLYMRTGFRKADGVRVDDVSTGTVLIESGFEARV